MFLDYQDSIYLLDYFKGVYPASFTQKNLLTNISFLNNGTYRLFFFLEKW